MIVTIGVLKSARVSSPEDVEKHFLSFEHARLRAYAYVAMFAPQSVMDCFDSLVDYLYDIADDVAAYDFGEIRRRGIAFVNAIRADLDIDPTPIEYRGARQ